MADITGYLILDNKGISDLHFKIKSMNFFLLNCKDAMCQVLLKLEKKFTTPQDDAVRHSRFFAFDSGELMIHQNIHNP